MEPDRQARAFEIIERNAASLTQMVGDVLDVSRIVGGKIRLNVQTVDLPLVVEEAVATIRSAADAKHVRLQVVVDPAAGPISGDPDRLQQIIWNLLSNAVRFTPKEGRVQLRLERVNSQVEIVVSDTGIGVPPGFLPHVFERFRQADSRFSREHGGLGLGLAITRDLVQLHGGTIQAFSEGEGRGATFRVQLPLMIVHPTAQSLERTNPAAETRQPTAPPKSLAGVRVLAVDDEGDALTLVRDVLEAAGATVVTANGAERALQALAIEVPEVMITDLGMPTMDGFALLEAMRASPDAGRPRRPGGGTHGLRPIRGSHPGVARGLPDAPGETDRSRRTGRGRFGARPAPLDLVHGSAIEWRRFDHAPRDRDALRRLPLLPRRRHRLVGPAPRAPLDRHRRRPVLDA